MGPRLAWGPLTDSHRSAQTIGVGELQHVLEPLLSLSGILVRVSPTLFHFLIHPSVGGAEVLCDVVRPDLPSSWLTALVPVLTDGVLAIEGAVLVVLLVRNPPSAGLEESRIPAEFAHVVVRTGLG